MTTGESPFVRAFVAVEINDSVRRGLTDAQSSLKKTRAHAAWVPPENIHVSLAFLGDITHEMAGQVSTVLDSAASSTKPFSFEVEKVGTFGARNSPRVIWAGARNVEALTALQTAAADGIKALGIELESRAFVPHLTLGRVRSSRGRQELVTAIDGLRERSFGRVDVSRIVLMRSILDPRGAQYSILHESPLTAR